MYYRKYTLIVAILAFIYPIRAEDVEENAETIKEYLEKICKNSPSCDIASTLAKKYQTLKIRNCMCDADCVRYNDCCSDVKENVNSPPEDDLKIECVEGVLNDVYMVTNCPSSWNDSEIINNCQNNDTKLLAVDVLLSTPVTTTSGLTYRNMFCAICHRQESFTFWTLHLTYKLLSNSINDSFANPATETSFPLAQVLDNVIIDDDFFFKFDINNETRRIFINSIPPNNLSSTIRFCVPNVITNCSQSWQDAEVSGKCKNYTSYVFTQTSTYKNPDCLACNHLQMNDGLCNSTRSDSKKLISEAFEVDISDKRIKKIPSRCKQIPSTLMAHSLVCPSSSSSSTSPPKSKKSSSKKNCVPRRVDTNKPCLINRVFTPDRIKFQDNTSMYFIDLDVSYPVEEWSTNITHIFLCGTYRYKSSYKKIMDVAEEYVTSFLIKISMICLVLHLLLFHQLPELKNLSGKNLAAFCFTLLIALFCFDAGPWLPSCKITAAVAHYSFLSCFMWMLVMAYDCWLSLYRATVKFRTSTGKHGLKFLIYCVVSWTLPLTIVGPCIYTEWSDSVDCPYKLLYGESKECFIFNQTMQYWTFFLPASIIFVGVLGFFGYTAYILYNSQKNTVNPNTRKDFQLYTRLALLMGITWTTGSLVGLFPYPILGMIFSILNMSQGISIFFAFTFKKKLLKSLLNKHKDNRFLTTTLSTFVGSDEVTHVSQARTESQGRNVREYTSNL